MNEEGIVRCLNCNKILKPVRGRYPKSQTCCQICRKAVSKRERDEAERVRIAIEKASKRHNRICKCGCGEPCAPNYFWKKGHEPRINDIGDEDRSFYERVS